MCLAIPAKIKKIDKNMATVDFGGVQKKISLGIMTNVKRDDYVLIHAGFAIGRLKTKEAEDTLKDLEELGTVGRTISGQVAEQNPKRY